MALSEPTACSALFDRIERTMQFEVSKWPAHYRQAAESAQLGFRAEKYDTGVGRRAFVLFCMHNGCRPKLFVQWLLQRECIKPDAYSEVKAVLQKLANGLPYGETWDMRRRQKVVAQMPPSNWDEVPRAIELLSQVKNTNQDGVSTRQTLRPKGCDLYYKTLFPFTDVAQLIHRSNSPLQLREIAIDCKVNRDRPVLDLQALRDKVDYCKATSLHVGPAYDKESQAQRLGGPLGTELVLEIDEVPDGLDEAFRWQWLRHAVEVASQVLRDEFGVRRVLCFASGNRGVHIWCMDEWILQQDCVARKQLVHRLHEPWHLGCWQTLAAEIMLPFYRDTWRAMRSQPHDEKNACSSENPSDRELARVTFPVFDQGVATQPTHLHRLPFSVHEKTGRIAVVFSSASQMPTSLEDLPHADDPQLAQRLQGSLSALHKTAAWVAEYDLKFNNIAEPAALGAAWMEACKRKRKRDSTGDAADSCAVVPFRVRRQETVNFVAALREAAEATSIDAISHTTVAEIASDKVKRARREEDKSTCWRDRLRREAKMLQKLLDALAARNEDVLVGETYNKGCGRTLTYYPLLDESTFIQRLHKSTRHVISGHEYYEIDCSAAHLAIAWSAVEQHYGPDDAKRRCPSLHIAATDKTAARQTVASQMKCTTVVAKRHILAALNQESNNRCAFLKSLCGERECMIQALRAHPQVKGEPLRSIKRQSQDNCIRELSLLLQTVEGSVLRVASATLAVDGFEVGALIADGLMCRLNRAAHNMQHEHAISATVTAIEQRVYSELGVAISLEVEHEARVP